MSAFLTLSQVSGGLPGTAPRIFTASTNDNLGAITTAGYMADKVATGVVNPFDIIFINYDVDGTEIGGTFIVTSTSSGSLVSYSSSANAGLASIGGLTTAADKSIYTTASNVYATYDLSAFARTYLDDANGPAVLTTLGISAFAQTLLDDASAAATLTTLTVKRGTTAAYAGGGTSNAYTATGLAATDIVTASILASTNAVSICKAVPTANVLTITFSADPGADTTVQWHALPA